MLTPKQRAIVESAKTKPVTVVAAGAGAGKTFTTIQAVLELLRAGESKPEEFVLITFTNKAAGELRRKLEEAFAGEYRQALVRAETGKESEKASALNDAWSWFERIESFSGAYIGTIHGYCNEILREHGIGAGLARESSVTTGNYMIGQAVSKCLDDPVTDISSLTQPGLAAHQVEKIMRDVVRRAIDRGLDMAEVVRLTEGQSEDANRPFRIALAGACQRAIEEYDRLKTESKRVDTADLIQRARDVVKCDPEVARRVAGRRPFLFVDEFQDTDDIQMELFTTLQESGCLRRLLVVGDRKQGIYDFRGASTVLIEQLAERTGVKEMDLNVTRRPTKQLLAAQNQLFSHFHSDYSTLKEPLEAIESKTIDSKSGIPPMQNAIFPNRDNLSARVAGAIQNLIGKQFEDPETGENRKCVARDIVILGRGNFGLGKLADELNGLLPPSISAKFEAGGRFYESDAVIATYRVLHLIAAYPNDTALLLALETPYLREIDAQEKVHWLLEHGAIDRLPLTGYVNTAHKEVFDRVNELRMDARIATVPQLLASLYEKFRIREYYRGRDDLQSVENLEQLREMARELFNNEQALTLRDFVDFLRTMILTDTAQDEAPLPNQGQGPENVVRLMTVHRSKGLEFPFVLIPDCSSELLSDRKSPWLVVDDTGPGLDLRVNGLRTESNAFTAFEQRMRQTQVEEEMRILYVAVTRAQHSVVFFALDIRAPKDPGRPYYSWADEITRAQPNVKGMVRI